MKKKLLLVVIMAIGFLFAGCNRNDSKSGSEGESGPGVIKVAIKGENSSASRAIGDPSQDLENTVHTFTVFVFNYSTGMLEKKQTFTNVLVGEIAGLTTASTKRVVVFVNDPVTSSPASYAALQELMVNLDSQVPGDFSTKGLFMSGEYSSAVTLNPTTKTSITVPVSRLVAKIRLSSLIVAPETPFLLEDFTLEGVSIQKARDNAPVLGNLAQAGDFDYVGGIVGSVSLVLKPYLYEAYALPTGYVSGTPLNPQIYFYVFPNNNTNDNATMLTLRGIYTNEAGTPVTMYYSFQVNNIVGTGGSTTDGNWVERNKIYTLNVTLKKIGLGGDDPDVPNLPAILEVTVTVADWEDELIQNVEW